MENPTEASSTTRCPRSVMILVLAASGLESMRSLILGPACPFLPQAYRPAPTRLQLPASAVEE